MSFIAVFVSFSQKKKNYELLCVSLWYRSLEAVIDGNSSALVQTESHIVESQVCGVRSPSDTHEQHVTLNLNKLK